MTVQIRKTAGMESHPIGEPATCPTALLPSRLAALLLLTGGSHTLVAATRAPHFVVKFLAFADIQTDDPEPFLNGRFTRLSPEGRRITPTADRRVPR